jgi:hypothetical protein
MATRNRGEYSLIFHCFSVTYLDSVKARNWPQNGHIKPRLRRSFDPADSARYAKPMSVEFLIPALVTPVVALTGGLLRLSIAPEIAVGAPRSDADR